MTRGLHATWVPPLAGLVQERLGLHFPRERWPDLVRGVREAAREAGVHDTEAFAQGVLRAARGPCFETLANALTVGETYFFREPRSFEVLRETILPELIRQRRRGPRRLRLWSAGCCTGEEPYTLAIVLDELLPNRSGWQVGILGTDLNARFLRAAARGEYGEWSFRGAPSWLKERCFTQVGHQRYAIAEPIRRMVKFAQMNLASMSDPAWDRDAPSMDVILCRNVLMYFSPDQAGRAVDRFQRSLADGGWFAVSATEGYGRFDGLAAVRFDGAVFHRKVAAGLVAFQPVPASRSESAVEQDDRGVDAGHDIGSTGLAPPPDARRPPEPEEAPAAPFEDHLRVARLHADAGRLDLALSSVEGALAVAKLDAGAHHLHAAILDELGRIREAKAALQRALYLEPDFVLAHHALGRLALREGSPAQAQRHFRHALALLSRLGADEPLPRAEGLVAGQLRALIEATGAKGST